MDKRENLVREIHSYQFRFMGVEVELIKSNTQYHGFLKVHQSMYPTNKIGEWRTISDTEGNSLRLYIGDEETYKSHMTGRYLEFEIDNRRYPNSRNCDLSHMSLSQLPDSVTYHTFKPYKKKYGDVEMYLRIPASHYIFKNWDAAKELKGITESRLNHSGYINNYHNDIDYSVTNIRHPYQGGLVTPK